jgi:hypothetical protein
MTQEEKIFLILAKVKTYEEGGSASVHPSAREGRADQERTVGASFFTRCIRARDSEFCSGESQKTLVSPGLSGSYERARKAEVSESEPSAKSGLWGATRAHEEESSSSDEDSH